MAHRRSSLGPLHHVTDTGRTLMPAFDKLANTLLGDNPALTQALRCAPSIINCFTAVACWYSQRCRDLHSQDGYGVTQMVYINVS